MIVPQDNSQGKILSIKRLKRGKIHSAISLKVGNLNNNLKAIQDNSYIFSQPHNYINDYFEESKNNSISNNEQKIISSLLIEKDKNLLKQSLYKSIKVNEKNENKGKANNIINNNNSNIKNKCIFLTYKENISNNIKKSNIKPINVHKFINIINSYLLPNDMTFENLKNLINYRIIHKNSSKDSEFSRLLKRNDILIKNNTFELFYKYIIKKTFKECLKKGVMNNILIEKKDIKKEYNKQLNEIKEYLESNNQKEMKDLIYNNSQELYDINNPSFINKLNENRMQSNKQYQIITINKHQKNEKINQNHNHSSDNINYHFYNFYQAYKEIKKQNLNSKNKELTKKAFKLLLTLSENSKFIKKIKINNPFLKIIRKQEKSKIHPEYNNLKNNNHSFIQEYIKESEKNNMNKENIFQTRVMIKKKPKNNQSSYNNDDKKQIKSNNNKKKREFIFKTEKSELDKIQGFNYILDTHNKNNSNNEDIISVLNNKKKNIYDWDYLFNKNLYNKNSNKISIDSNKENSNDNDNENENDNEDLNKYSKEENSISKSSRENNDKYNNSFLYSENDYKLNSKDLSLFSQPKFKSSSLKNNFSQKLFEDKCIIDPKFFKLKSECIKKNNVSICKIYSQLFYKDTKRRKNEKEKILVKKIENSLNKKIFVKKKAKKDEKTFKQFIKESLIEEKNDLINNVKIEDKNDTNKKIEEEEKKEKDLENRFNNFKNYIQKMKNMSKNEFINDTLRSINLEE